VLNRSDREENANSSPVGRKPSKAFDDLKQALCNVHCMHSPVIGRDFVLRCDSSDYAVGACLSQLDEENRELPIAYASQKLTDVQQRWAVIHREAFAVIWALTNGGISFYSPKFIFQRPSTVVFFDTDHAKEQLKLIRWSLALQEYDINFSYVPGKNNCVADMASRLVE